MYFGPYRIISICVTDIPDLLLHITLPLTCLQYSLGYLPLYPSSVTKSVCWHSTAWLLFKHGVTSSVFETEFPTVSVWLSKTVSVDTPLVNGTFSSMVFAPVFNSRGPTLSVHWIDPFGKSLFWLRDRLLRDKNDALVRKLSALCGECLRQAFLSSVWTYK